MKKKKKKKEELEGKWEASVLRKDNLDYKEQAQLGKKRRLTFLGFYNIHKQDFKKSLIFYPDLK